MEKNRVIRITTDGLLIAIVAGVLSVVFVEDSLLPAGELASQWSWLSKTGMLFGLIALTITIVTWKRETRGSFFYKTVVWILILYGGIEAIYGLRQIYGFSYSNHSLFAVTGSFFNPGPYSGYLAMVFPLCLNEWLESRNVTCKGYYERIMSCLAAGILLLIICILPAGMSRSAWMAAIVSGVWVYAMHVDWKGKLDYFWRERRIAVVTTVVLSVLIGLAIVLFVFCLKKDSANGRLFMWKISCYAIAEKPLTGHGYNGFACAYGKAQEAYFAGKNYSEQEETVAGSPEYAFDEYLHLAVEWGIPVCLAVWVVVGFCFWRGVTLRRYSACGGVISLLVFSFSSYPMQLPAFIVSLLFLLAACTIKNNRMGMVFFSLLIFVIGVGLWKKDTSRECQEWANSKMLYNMGIYVTAKEDYTRLYPVLKNRGSFLFEYGHCLHKLKEYEFSNKILQEAEYYSSDPMILNIIGKNFQELKEYEKAENYLIRSTHRLPGRIYPYYLLARLYNEWNRSDKMKEMAKIVLTKDPKIQSTAILEMRTEINKLIHPVSHE